MDTNTGASCLIPDEHIASKVLLIRGIKVMLDKDLAELYGVTTGNLNKAVERNIRRFPEDFMFKLNKEEFNNLIFQSGIPSWGGRRTMPNAFTEQGVAMLSSVLKSERAVDVNIQIIRTFTRLRHILARNTELQSKIEELDGHVQSIYKILGQLLIEDEKPKRQIGFRVDTG
jgi:phage regulator Rha-like protein